MSKEQGQFVHLRVHSEYALLDGIVRIKSLVSTVREQASFAVALTDHVNLFAAVKFYQAAVAQGIKPIIGADILIAHPEDPSRPFRMTLLCQNQIGYLNLTQLISKAYIRGQHNNAILIEPAWLKAHHDGLIALSGALEGDVGQALLKGNVGKARECIATWQQLFGDRYYLEVQRIGQAQEETYLQQVAPLAVERQVALCATNAVCFIHPSDHHAHEARVCIQEGHSLQDPRRQVRHTEQQWLRDPETMVSLFSDLPQAIQNTVLIAKRCNLKLNLGQVYLPNFPTPSGISENAYLGQQAREGLSQRLALAAESEDAAVTPDAEEYAARLSLELSVIENMGYPGYFLIVADFIQWAKTNCIPVGPGRGSGAGSLVAYALGITELDPLKYGLLFERFLNPERVSMPDFDIDFCMDGRDRVIDYVAERYGRQCVSQIITFGTMAAKAVVRDVGRVLGQPYGFVDKIAKLIPFEIGMTLAKALEQETDLQQRYTTEDDVRELIDLAKKLEGITRNAGKHAGGVVISPSALTDFTPLYCEPNAENIVTQFDKDDVETVGLVKFDFLGLRTLTIIDWTVQAVNAQRAHQGLSAIDISRIPTEDEKTFELLKACQTTAVFQLESRGMKDLMKRLVPDCFEEIIALVALFRPGPLQSGMVDDFINRKHGRAKVEYPHPKLEAILKPTYGVILYQEQVMQIAQVLAGYSLGAADLLRRAMGKKKPEEMAKQRDIFTSGAQAQGVDAATATYIFDLMEKFAGYGFNKSHSAAYALVAYQTAWLKAHYAAAFMAAVLSSDMDNTDKVVTFVHEVAELNLTLLPPNVNISQGRFVAIDATTISYGLSAIKGVGAAAVESIVASVNAQGDFVSLFDFCTRVDLRKLNRRALEALVSAGALDALGGHRACLIANIDKAIAYAEQIRDNQRRGQQDLFASRDLTPDPPELTATRAWSNQAILSAEKEALGFYLSGHPLASYQAECKQFTTAAIAELDPNRHKMVLIAGLVLKVRKLTTKRGKRMAVLTLDDQSARLDVAVFSEVYAECYEDLTVDALLVVQGEVSQDTFTGGTRLTAEKIWPLATAREHFAQQLSLDIYPDRCPVDVLDQIRASIEPFCPGTLPIVIRYHHAKASAELVLGEDWNCQLDDKVIQQLRELLGNQAVNVKY